MWYQQWNHDLVSFVAPETEVKAGTPLVDKMDTLLDDITTLMNVIMFLLPCTS